MGGDQEVQVAEVLAAARLLGSCAVRGDGVEHGKKAFAFTRLGGWGKAVRVFGAGLAELIEDVNQQVAA